MRDMTIFEIARRRFAGSPQGLQAVDHLEAALKKAFRTEIDRIVTGKAGKYEYGSFMFDYFVHHNEKGEIDWKVTVEVPKWQTESMAATAISQFEVKVFGREGDPNADFFDQFKEVMK